MAAKQPQLGRTEALSGLHKPVLQLNSCPHSQPCVSRTDSQNHRHRTAPAASRHVACFARQRRGRSFTTLEPEVSGLPDLRQEGSQISVLDQYQLVKQARMQRLQEFERELGAPLLGGSQEFEG